ncbi:MAG TPA: transcriptional regulator [Myxococcota bacterium]|nr:transcriptional regulator [Myxococcota bacterium]
MLGSPQSVLAAGGHVAFGGSRVWAERWSEARRAWPELRLPEEHFADFVAERLASPDCPDEELASLRLSDLYLACGCLRHDPAALSALEQRVFPRVEAAVRRLGSSTVAPQDVSQRLYEKLLLPGPDGRLKLANYAGRGDLLGWLCIVAIREARALTGRAGREVASEEELLERLDAPADPELGYLKQHYLEEFRAAFGEALAALEAKERNILRFRLVHDMSIDDLGALYHVHRATCARWVQRIEHRLFQLTREALRRRLTLSEGEFDSVIRLLQSQLYVSVVALLHRQADDPPAP